MIKIRKELEDSTILDGISGTGDVYIIQKRTIPNIMKYIYLSIVA
jgi:hypothetical protein